MKFYKEERLKSTKIISRLFKEGRSFSCYPLRLVYLEVVNDVPIALSVPTEPVTLLPMAQPTFPIQFSLTVPKKNFKRAVDRNVLRRRLREAYRLNKIALYNFLNEHPDAAILRGKQFAFMVMYVAKEELPYEDIDKGMKKLIYKFRKEMLGQ